MKNIIYGLLGITALIALYGAHAAIKDSDIATLRKAPILTNVEPPSIKKVDNSDIIKGRSYPMQPPVIPHQVANDQISTNVNSCMRCHSRERVSDSQAPMVSVTHFMNREGNFLAELSPRRYFCTQCHVTQISTKLQVDNDFTDMHSLISDSN